MKLALLKNVLAVFSTLVTTQALAATYDYHPGMTLRLGQSFDPQDPFTDRSRGGCFQWTEEGSRSSEKGAKVEFKMDVIKSRSQFYEHINVSSSLAARYTFVKAKATFANESQLSFTENDVVFVVTGSKTFPAVHRIGNINLSEQGNSLMKKARWTRKVPAFFEVCGKEIVTSELRGGSVSVVYSFHSSDRETANKIRSHLEVKAKMGSANVDFLREIKKIDQKLEIHMQAFQTGASQASPKLLNLIRAAPGDVSAIENTIVESLEEVTPETAPVLSVTTMKVADVPEVKSYLKMEATSLDSRIDDRLIELQDRLFTNQQRLQLLTGILQNYTPENYQADSLEKLKELYRKAREQNQAIQDLAQKCLTASKISDCESMDIVPEPLLISGYFADFILNVGWSRSENGFQSDHERYSLNEYLFPVINFRNTPYIRKLTLTLNGSPAAVVEGERLQALLAGGISWNGIFSRTYSITNQYCFSARLGGYLQQCINAGRPVLIAEAIAAETNINYGLIVEAVDGQTYKYKLPNYSTARLN